MRLPYEPLERYLQRGQIRYRTELQIDTDDGLHGMWTDALGAQILDTTVRQIQRWKRAGLTATEADELAIHAGSHPLELWGMAWRIAEASEDLEHGKQCSECPDWFVDRSPKRDRAVCSTRCRQRRQVRVKRARIARERAIAGVLQLLDQHPPALPPATETERTAA